MCPGCFAGAAVIAASVSGAGGLTALLVKTFRHGADEKSVEPTTRNAGGRDDAASDRL